MTEAVSFAGKILEPHAKVAAKKVSGWIGFTRWRIEREVRSKTGLNFDGRTYRQWLRNLDVTTWERSVEAAAPELAFDLDDRLEAADRSWRENRHNVSTAATLVQETYLAVLAQCTQEEAARLTEQWSRERNQTVIEHIGNLARTRGGLGRLDGDDLASYLGKRSRARRRNRLAALGVDDSESSLLVFESMPARFGNIPAGHLRCLVGPFGIGKSEAAEEWHRDCYQRCKSNPEAPVPVWLHVREITGSLTTVLNQEAGNQTVSGIRGLAVVVDGLDETDSSTAERILNEARVFLAGAAKSSFLLTTRPGVVTVQENEEIQMDPLSREDAARLVAAVSGQSHTYDGMPPLVRESAGRPLFAIAAARALSQGEAPPSPAAVLDQIVKTALRRGEEKTRIASPAAFDHLMELAVKLTNDPSATSTLDFITKAYAEASRLVFVDAAGECRFSLAIIQQWFAAQALLTGVAPLDYALADPLAFDHWRWAVAIAISSGPNSTVDEVLTRSLTWNPGSASWLLDQVTSSALGAHRPVPPLADVQKRLLSAGRTWADALGPAAPAVFPIGTDRSLGLKLGVRTGADYVHYAWSDDPQDADSCVALPSPDEPIEGRWFGETRRHGFHDAAWPWQFVRSDVDEQLQKALRTPGLLGGSAGVWADETAYHICRAISENSNVFHEPIDSTEIARFLEERLNGDRDILIKAPKGPALSAKWLLRYLGNIPEGLLRRPLPSPDLKPNENPNICSLYSPRRQLEYVTELYGSACIAYEEICDNTFPSFDWSLSHQLFRPLAVIGALSIIDQDDLIGQPTISYRVVSQESLHRIVPTSSDSWFISKTKRCALKILPIEAHRDFRLKLGFEVKNSSDFVSEEKRTSPFARSSFVHSIVDLNGDRASSAVSLNWLSEDLSFLGLLTRSVTLSSSRPYAGDAENWLTGGA